MRSKRLVCWVLMLLVLIQALCIPALADEHDDRQPDYSRTGSISVDIRTLSGDPVPGGTVTLYCVAEAVYDDGDNIFVFTDAFSDCGLDLAVIDTEDSGAPELAAKLAKYAKLQRIRGTKAEVGRNGHVEFTGLQLGLYLVVQDKAPDRYYPITPFCVTIPMWDGQQLVYDVNANPKVQPTPEPDPEPAPGTEPGTEPTPATPGDGTGPAPSGPDGPGGQDEPEPPDAPLPPPEEGGDDGTPTTRPDLDAWALVNLLCAIGTVLTALLMLLTISRKQDKGDKEEREQRQAQEGEEPEDEKRRAKKWTKLLGLIPAVWAVVVFFLTEDIRLPMIYTDKWTLLMAVIFVFGLIMSVITRHKDDDSDGEDERERSSAT